jgi:hypothetical protein
MVDLIRESPGFVESYWTYEHSNGKSMGFTLLDTSEHAHDLRNAVESRIEDHMEWDQPPRFQLEMIRVQEITAYMTLKQLNVEPAQTVGTEPAGRQEGKYVT